MSEDSAVDNKVSQATSSATPVASSSSSSSDTLVCQWAACGERLPSPEELYDHVCERHVGRKSTNNLNLTCQWGSCRTTTVKRDHITSHIRVHVPLKPHKCEFCGKAFKRPQDLKKHVKTHADDSVLLRSPEPSRGTHTGNNSNYATSANKLVADLQSLAATAQGYYGPDSHSLAGAQSGYYANSNVNHPTYHGGAVPQQGSAYGPVYYAVAGTQNANAEYEMRKRAAFDALNEFFGDAKRRVIDPTTYYDVGQRLASLNNVQLPMLNGYGGGGVQESYSGGGGGGGGGTAVHAAHQPLLNNHYSLPMPNLRTKNDLLNIDHFLEQLQNTVYETPSAAAAAGVNHPSTYMPMTGHRTSNSPPLHTPGGYASANTPGSTGNETPALTPASSVLSYPSAHSPGSVHSAHTISPVSRSSIGSMYPTLPSVSAMSDFSAFNTTSGPPSSGLASAFDPDQRRRYSGGTLQRAKPAYEEGNARTPRAGSPPSVRVEDTDAALKSPTSRSSSTSEDDADRKTEQWVDNIRIIESLRSFIKERLERAEYHADESASAAAAGTDADRMEIDGEESTEGRSLYPSLRDA